MIPRLKKNRERKKSGANWLKQPKNHQTFMGVPLKFVGPGSLSY